MKYYCQTLRGLKKGLGNGYKNILPCEVNTRKAFSRFAVAGRDIVAGATIQKNDIEYKKVVTGILPKYNHILIGAIATIDIKSDEIIDWPMIAFQKHID
jgi:sialic acid synthase SpsE